MTDTKCQVVDVVKTLFVTKSDDLVKAKRSLLIPTWKVRDQFGNHQDEEKTLHAWEKENLKVGERKIKFTFTKSGNWKSWRKRGGFDWVVY